MEIAVLGIDLGKNSCSIVGLDHGGAVVLRRRMRREGVKLVVRERHYPAGLAETIAQRTGSKLVELPAMVGGVPEARDYVSFIDYNVRTMLKAVQGG